MNLYVDTSKSMLVASSSAATRVEPPPLTVGDTLPLVLAFLQRNPQPLNTGRPVYLYQDFSSSAIVLSIGPRSGPILGTFGLTFGGNTAANLSFNISSYALSIALNALASITAAGGVFVEGTAGGPYQIIFNLNGAQALFSSGPNSFFPVSTVTIVSDEVGTVYNPSVQVVTLMQSPAVTVSSWTAQPAAAVVVTQLSGNLIQRVAIPDGTYGGTFTLTYNGNTTGAIPFAAQIDVVAAAMNALPGITGATVWPGSNYWDITIPSGAFTITGNATGLVIPLTLTGTLPLTSRAVADLLGTVKGAVVPIIIQATASTFQTLYAGQVLLRTS